MRLIDTDAFLIDESKAYISAQNRTNDSLTRTVNLVTHKKIQKLITDAPTVDAEPVRHGEWEHDLTGANFCSVCGEYPYDDGMYHMIWNCKYCPNCGAKMDKNEQN